MVDIPNVPGVPALANYAVGNFTLITSDLVGFLAGGLITNVWGIFLFGVPVLVFADNFVTFEIKGEWSVPDYPVEQGSFQSYNKVALPKEIRVQVSCGGSETKRQAFIDSIELLLPNTFLYDVVTPERVYLNYNYTHYDYARRADRGAGLVTINLYLTEIRQSAIANFLQTLAPGISGAVGLGNVQPQSPPTALGSLFSTSGGAAAGGVM